MPNYAEASDATAKLTFTGSNVAWVVTRGPGRGEAEVDVDGVKTTVDLYSSATQYRKVVFKESGLDPLASHTIEVKLLGTSGRPRVDVDAFVVLS